MACHTFGESEPLAPVGTDAGLETKGGHHQVQEGDRRRAAPEGLPEAVAGVRAAPARAQVREPSGLPEALRPAGGGDGAREDRVLGALRVGTAQQVGGEIYGVR